MQILKEMVYVYDKYRALPESQDLEEAHEPHDGLGEAAPLDLHLNQLTVKERQEDLRQDGQ